MQANGPAPIPARWFDGRSSQAQPVLVSLAPGPKGPSLHLHLHLPSSSSDAPRVFPYAQVGWPEAWSAAKVQRTVIVDLRDAGSLEIDAVAPWNAMLAAAGARAPLAERMQTRWRVFIAVLLVAAVGLWACYRWGTPWAATQLTRQVPLNWETALAQRALLQLDEGMLKPSKLPAERQAQLQQRFAALASSITPNLKRYPAYAPALTLAFRSGMGANAFALPGGAIVMTDGLVEAAAKRGLGDDALLGVLAHELGHVMHRHTTRIIVEQGVLNVGLGLALGDVSSVVSMGSSLLTGLAYRRNHETEADCFGLALMQKAQLPTVPMADLLLGIDGEQHEKQPPQDGASGASSSSSSSSSGGASRAGRTDHTGDAASGLASLLSSHPDTRERAERLKRGEAQGC